MKPKVSIVIPVYNVEQYLGKCLDSVVNQSLRDIEIICVNDGSTDGSLAILEEYASQDDRIAVISKENAGYGAAMNDGISAAHGEYIGIVEPDDYVSLEMFGDLYNIAVSGDTKMDVVKSAWYQFSSGGNGDNKLINPYKSVPQRCSIDVRAHSRILLYHPSIWSGIYRAGFLEGHSIRFLEAPGAGWVDNPFFLETLYYSENTAVTCQPYYHYQVARDGGSSSMKDCLVPFLRLGEMFDFLESKSDSSIFFESLCKRFFFYLRNVLNSPYYGERERETRELISSIVSRIPRHILEGALFTDRDRKNYARFSSANYSTSQMGDPKVSVIVPCFNTVDYLAECLDSLVEQTLEDIEIICVDDGSTDDTRFMLREYAADDSRVRVICQIENGGYGKAVNAGLKQARGEYVGIVEPDDFVDARTYKVLYSEAVGNCLDVCKADFCRFWREDSGNLKTSYVRVCSKDEFYGVVFDPSLNQETLIGVPPSICAGLYKRDFLRRNCVWVNETPGASYQDNGFFFQTMFSAKRVKYLKRCFYWCRRDNPNSSVHNTGKVYAMNEEYEFIERWLKEDPLRWEKCKEAYISIAFANYLWTLNRIGVEHKREYLNYLSQALSGFISENKVNLSKCSDSAKSKIRWIISDPESFYSQNIINSREVARLKKENGALRKRVEKFQASPSWRIGRAITFLPRKLKKALKKNGLDSFFVRKKGSDGILLVAGDTKYSGATLSLVTLAQGVKAAGYKVHIVFPGRGPIEKVVKDLEIPYSVIPSIQWVSPKAFSKIEVESVRRKARSENSAAVRKIRGVIRRCSIGLVHSNSIGVFVGAEAARREKVKHLWHIREFMEEDHQLQFWDIEEVVNLLNSSNAIAYVSNAVRDKWGQAISKESKVEEAVIYNGIDLSSFLVLDRELFTEGSIRLTVSGRVCDGKNQIEAIRAMAAIVKRHPSAKLTLVGERRDMGYYREVIEQIASLGLEGNVFVPGPTTAMNQIWAQTDIAIVPSRREAFGRSAVEAMLAGAIVVGANTGGTKEVVAEGCGYLYELGNPNDLAEVVNRILDDRAEAVRISKAGQAWAADHFSSKKNERAILRLYRELFER